MAGRTGRARRADRIGRIGAPGPGGAPGLSGRLALALLVGLLAGPDAAPGEPTEGSAPVPLEELLSLPETYRPRLEQRGGATRSEWRERFRLARQEVEEARAGLRRAQAELESHAGDAGDWNLAPPGVGAGLAGDARAQQLRAEIKRYRRELQRAERQLRELEVEAELAGVPDEWIAGEASTTRR